MPSARGSTCSGRLHSGVPSAFDLVAASGSDGIVTDTDRRSD